MALKVGSMHIWTPSPTLPESGGSGLRTPGPSQDSRHWQRNDALTQSFSYVLLLCKACEGLHMILLFICRLSNSVQGCLRGSSLRGMSRAGRCARENVYSSTSSRYAPMISPVTMITVRRNGSQHIIGCFLADRTARRIIGSWHHNVVCPSVRPSVCLSVCNADLTLCIVALRVCIDG